MFAPTTRDNHHECLEKRNVDSPGHDRANKSRRLELEGFLGAEPHLSTRLPGPARTTVAHADATKELPDSSLRAHQSDPNPTPLP
jgi:hypothetical protein